MLHSLYPRTHRRYLSLPLLGSIADGLDDWLASNGYTQLSRQRAIGELPHVDAELRRRQIKEIPRLTLAVLHDCWGCLLKKYSNRAATVRALERYLTANGLIVPARPATATSTASKLIEEYANFLHEVHGSLIPLLVLNPGDLLHPRGLLLLVSMPLSSWASLTAAWPETGVTKKGPVRTASELQTT